MICPEKKVHGDRKYVPVSKRERNERWQLHSYGVFYGVIKKVLKLGRVGGWGCESGEAAWSRVSWPQEVQAPLYLLISY